MELFTISRSQAGLADKRRSLVSRQCVQTASHPGWHEKRLIAEIPAAPPPTDSHPTDQVVCTDPVAPANHCRIIRALGEPLETLLIGPQTFQGCGLTNGGHALAGTASFRPISGFDSQPQTQAGGGGHNRVPCRWAGTGQDPRGILSFLGKLVPSPSHELNMGRR